MRFSCLVVFQFLYSLVAAASPTAQVPLLVDYGTNRTISTALFTELEELSRIVDISYCVGLGGLGIQKPFQCLGRCSEFEDFELIATWNTGPLFSDSCGYIALSHSSTKPRIIVAFRGTYSITNALVDLSTVPQEYIPYPGDDGELQYQAALTTNKAERLNGATVETPKCGNCTVHMGFYSSWLTTRKVILNDLAKAIASYRGYALVVVGHSLGGAVATIGALEMKARGWNPTVTTFGEPRVGNRALMEYIDMRFNLPADITLEGEVQKFRRVTHIGDPVPLLPLEEWGYRMHAGEIFIEKPDLPAAKDDLKHCSGDEDPACIAGNTTSLEKTLSTAKNGGSKLQGIWPISDRLRLWEILFAHRDYFWRLGLCVPGGDPTDWYRNHSHSDHGKETAVGPTTQVDKIT